MLSARINPDPSDDDEEGQSPMPGDYEVWPRPTSRVTPRANMTPLRPSVPPPSRTSRRSASVVPKPWPPVTPHTSPVRPRRRRRRSITPEIVIERPQHRHSSSRHRIITIPLDNRPTLGLRGPPKRVLEIEQIPCRRRRKHRSSCYEYDYDVPPPPPIQSQPNVVFINPLSNPYLLPAQPSLPTTANNSASWFTSFSNLTPDMIENLPRQTVHLPPIHLPGSQANVNTELQTVIFPAEIINPINGTLSIIQSDPTRNVGARGVVQSPALLPAQPHLTSGTPPNVQSPLTALSMASGPFMQQVQDLFHRITFPQLQQAPHLSYNQGSIQPSASMVPQYNAQTIPPVNTMNRGPYPPANIQPLVTPNSGSSNPTTFTPVTTANTTSYPPANISPYRPISSTQYNPPHTTSYQPASTGPYRPANITPYQTTTSNFTPSNSLNIGPYRSANITPYSAGLNRPDVHSILPPSIPSASTPYITPPALNFSDSFNSSSSGTDHRALHIPQSSQTPYQSSTPMPKSILRNAPSNHFSNTTYSRLNPPNMLSPTGIVRPMATVV